MKRSNIENYASCKAYEDNANPQQFEKCINLLETLLDQHNRLLVCRCTLRAGKVKKDGSKVDGRKAIEKLLRSMKTKYKSDFYSFVWTFEYSEEKKEHFHLTIFLNANKYQNDFMALKPFMEQWERYTENDAHISVYKAGLNPVRSTGRIDRGDTARFNDITEGLSYLCKTSQKVKGMKRAFSMTQLKSLTNPDDFRKKVTKNTGEPLSEPLSL